MAGSQLELGEIHWMLDMFRNIDVGLVVLDRDFRVQVWNGFMENHSGLTPYSVKNQLLFDVCTEVDEEWFRHKAAPVFDLKNRAFTIWEQRAYIFKFRNYRPITGFAEFMYQNATFIPLSDLQGRVQHICVLVYDVTNVAVNKLELEAANLELARLSRTDSLTGLNNRGFWEECLHLEYNRSRRQEHSKTSLLMFDIDHFKRINDTFGHAAGDVAIQHCSSILQENLRESDVAGRYGGEEFAIILSDTFNEDAKVFAERIRLKIQQVPAVFQQMNIPFTISVGIAEFSPHFQNHTNWIKAADHALYQSKQNGRNQVTTYTQNLSNQ